VAVKLRLVRIGKTKQPHYRLVAADSRSPRNGRFIEILGTYNPRSEPSDIAVDNDRAVDWLRKGAQPTDTARKLLTISGAWEAFTGEPTPPPPTPKPPKPKPEPAAEAPVAEAEPEEAPKPEPEAVAASEEATAAEPEPEPEAVAEPAEAPKPEPAAEAPPAEDAPAAEDEVTE
jgi:small subunit ribosomal protein S16